MSGRADAKDIDVFGSAYSLVSEEEKSLIEKSFVVPDRINLPEKSYFVGRTSVSRLETFSGVRTHTISTIFCL